MSQPLTNTQRWRTAMWIGGGLLACLVGLAVPQFFGSNDSKAAGPELTPIVMRLVVVTAVVLALCAIATRMFGKRMATMATNSDELELLEVVPVGMHCRVHLVRTGDQLLLVGTDPSGVKSLIELPEDIENWDE